MRRQMFGLRKLHDILIDWEIDRFSAELSRREIIEQSLENYGYILVADTLMEAIDAANEIASEHLEILTANPFEVDAHMTKYRLLRQCDINISRSYDFIYFGNALCAKGRLTQQTRLLRSIWRF